MRLVVIFLLILSIAIFITGLMLKQAVSIIVGLALILSVFSFKHLNEKFMNGTDSIRDEILEERVANDKGVDGGKYMRHMYNVFAERKRDHSK
jgi:hypothetical protein